jgi:hypothetical protein
MSTSRDIRELLEAPASSGRDAFLISKTIFAKIGTGNTTARQQSASHDVSQLWPALRKHLAHNRMSQMCPLGDVSVSRCQHRGLPDLSIGPRQFHVDTKAGAS